MKNFQSLVALVCALVIVAACVLISILSRVEKVQSFVEQGEFERFRSGGGIYMNRASFIDFEDRLLLDELPKTDFNRGGVYFFGTSTTKWGLLTRELTDADRSLIHNFGIGASSHRHTAQLIRFLSSHHGLLNAGSDKVHVVIGSFWSMGKDWKGGFFGDLWGRYGLYKHDEGTGITALPNNALQRMWAVERARMSAFISVNARRTLRALMSATLGRARAEPGMPPADEIRGRAFENADVPAWDQELQVQLAELRSIARELRSAGVKVTIVHLPTRTAYSEMALPVRYAAEIKALALDERLDFVDLSRLLQDDEFVDVNHVNYKGLLRLNDALMQVARPQLDELHKQRN